MRNSNSNRSIEIFTFRLRKKKKPLMYTTDFPFDFVFLSICQIIRNISINPFSHMNSNCFGDFLLLFFSGFVFFFYLFVYPSTFFFFPKLNWSFTVSLYLDVFSSSSSSYCIIVYLCFVVCSFEKSYTLYIYIHIYIYIWNIVLDNLLKSVRI